MNTAVLLEALERSSGLRSIPVSSFLRRAKKTYVTSETIRVWQPVVPIPESEGPEVKEDACEGTFSVLAFFQTSCPLRLWGRHSRCYPSARPVNSTNKFTLWGTVLGLTCKSSSTQFFQERAIWPLSEFYISFAISLEFRWGKKMDSLKMHQHHFPERKINKNSASCETDWLA